MHGCSGYDSVASAAPHHPTGEFASFADCPLNNSAVVNCFYSLSSGGSFTIGTKTVPLKKSGHPAGGMEFLPEAPIGSEFRFVGAEDGNTLSKTPQPVPGGLLGITAPSWWPQILKDLFNEVVINQGATGVTATVELAKPASSVKISLLNYIEQKGTALGLPVKVKLGSAFLGSNCYIGSNPNPIYINLTTGTTSPPPPTRRPRALSGRLKPTSLHPLHLRRRPRRRQRVRFPGCKRVRGILFSWLVDPFVDSILGTPSAAGKNTAILEGKQDVAESSAVRASE